MRLWLLLLPAIVAASCTTTRSAVNPPAPPGFPDHSLQEVIARIPTPDSLWQRFSGDMSIAYSVPEERGTLNARIAYRRADSILIRFRAPLGIEVSRVLMTGDSLFVYDRVNRKLYYGARGVAERMLPIGFWRADVAAAVFGYDDLRQETWAMRVVNDWYVLESADGLRTVIVDPGLWRVIASDTRNQAGMIVDQRRFAEFDRIHGLLVPRRIVTSRPEKDVRSSISIRRLTPDPEDLSFDLGAHRDAERIPVY